MSRETLEPILFLLQSHDVEVQRAASAALGNLGVNSELLPLFLCSDDAGRSCDLYALDALPLETWPDRVYSQRRTSCSLSSWGDWSRSFVRCSHRTSRCSATPSAASPTWLLTVRPSLEGSE